MPGLIGNEISYDMLPNDVEHPIIVSKKEVYQEIAPWKLLWIIAEPEAVNRNRGEKH